MTPLFVSRYVERTCCSEEDSHPDETETTGTLCKIFAYISSNTTFQVEWEERITNVEAAERFIKEHCH